VKTPAEDCAARFVSLYAAGPGGSYGVLLTAPGTDPVVIGRTPNPAVAREWAAAVCRFVAAVREAGVEVQPKEVADGYLTELPKPSTGGHGGRLVEFPG
jgi:hypothetical protein